MPSPPPVRYVAAMTASTLPAPTAWSLPGLDGVLSFLSTACDSIYTSLTESAAVVHGDSAGPMDAAVHSLGRSLLAARTEEELANLTAEALSKPWLPTFLALSVELFAERTAKLDTLVADDQARALQPIKHPVARMMVQAHMLTGELMKAMRAIFPLTTSESGDSALREAGDRVLLHRHEGIAPIFADPSLPPRVAVLLLASFEGVVAMFGLYELIRRDGLKVALDRPIARMLATQWVSGIRQHLRLMASFPESSVPENVIPLDERLDLPALYEANRATRLRWHEAPEQSQLNIDALPELDDDA